MAETAFQKVYRQEAIAGFEQMQSLLRDTCTTEGTVKGNQIEFLVADSGDAEAVTRGVNGAIPARGDNLTQNTCTLVEWHDLVRKTNFNIFASQSDQRGIMQRTTMGVINRKTDEQIITELNTGTVNTGSAATASLNLVTRAITILGNASVPWDGRITGLITHAFLGYLMQLKEFASAEYVNARPTPTNQGAWNDQQKVYQWMGVNWVVHPNLPGKGSAAEKCFLYHASAIGHGADTAGMKTAVGYDDEQDYSYARASMYMGAKLLQNSGVVVVNHDGSALSA